MVKVGGLVGPKSANRPQLCSYQHDSAMFKPLSLGGASARLVGVVALLGFVAGIMAFLPGFATTGVWIVTGLALVGAVWIISRLRHLWQRLILCAAFASAWVAMTLVIESAVNHFALGTPSSFDPIFVALVAVVLYVPVATVCAVTATEATRLVVRSLRRAPHGCTRCGYPLETRWAVCSECGKPAPRADAGGSV